MPSELGSNKTKIAKRVIEVFEFFDAAHPQATVMDIVRRYGRPQSSTSELMQSLVEMGMLYKEPRSRSFAPTPRLAGFGLGAQPSIIRDGRLLAFMERLASSTRHAVALFGVVGSRAQIFQWTPGSDALTQDLYCGVAEPLSASAAGLLLVSAMAPDQIALMLRRLNAEAPEEAKFSHADYAERVAAFRRQGHASGVSGFVTGGQVTAVLLPRGGGERPIALGVIYPEAAAVDSDALAATLVHGIAQCSLCEDAIARPPVSGALMMVV